MSAARKLAPPRPKAPGPKWDQIPAELTSRPQWVCWAYTLRQGKWTKAPRQPALPNESASSTDPSTWSTFEAAKATCLRHPKTVDGVGYVFAPDDPFVGVDFDACLTADGQIEEWAAPYLERFEATYLEVSPSGRGVKGFARSKLPGDGKGKKKGGYGPEKAGAIEIYEKGRFFTVTGDAWSEHADLSSDVSEELATLYAELASRPRKASAPKPLIDRPDRSDEDLVDLARRSSNGAKFSALYDRGDTSSYASDDSSADMALMNMLAFWTGKDAGRMERIFGQSALGQREKWARADYRQRTIEEAIAYVGDTYSRSRNGKATDGAAPLRVFEGDGGNGTRNGAAAGAGSPRFNLTDLGNAERLIHRHGHDLRYCHPWKKWLVFDKRRWAIDNTGAARRLVKETARSIYGEVALEESDDRRKALAKHAHETEKRDKLAAMLQLAEMERPILPDEIDQNPWLFNCRNGTIDLRTGELGPHRREDYIAQLCNLKYDPKAACPLWLKTLELFFNGDEDLIGYFQRICGYAMTGVVRDHIMPIAYGVGSNGKSTMLGTLIDVFGPDYAMKAPSSLLMAKKLEGHSTEVSDLFGKRLVVAIETEDGRRLNESLVKELTGGDRVRARRMREDNWEFSPTHTLIMATNHKPGIRGTDEGIWRRLRLVPFAVQVRGEKDDKSMREKLRDEFPGILAWCVRGCLDWQAKGLDEPSAVTEATSEYRESQDVLGAFIEECCVVGMPSYKVQATPLYDAYKAWAERAGEPAKNQRNFGMAMTERGFKRGTNNGTWYEGITLR